MKGVTSTLNFLVEVVLITPLTYSITHILLRTIPHAQIITLYDGTQLFVDVQITFYQLEDLHL